MFLSLALLGACATAGPGESPYGQPPRSQGGEPATRGFDAAAALHGPRLSEIADEPMVRIRVARAKATLTISADAGVTFRAAGGEPLRLMGPVTVGRAAGVWRLTDARGVAMEFRGQRLEVDPSSRGITHLQGAAYPGRITLLAAEKSANGLDAINTVGMETYLPGVLQRELFASWHPAAFEAQAVAARSYALWEMARSRLRGKAFDLESTTASQAYAGVAANPKAGQAVGATRGVVLSWEGRVLPAFYSSSHGPVGADATDTFAGRVADLPPLRGQAHGTRDAQSPRFNWQASRDATDLARRLAAWGVAERHPVASVAPPIRSVELAKRSAVGRHASYVVTDGAGRRFEIAADALRHAANHDTPGLPKPDKTNTLYSGQFVPVVRGTTVVFTQGHGHGHGVGMSQYGAQAMASQGSDHRAILAAYYPNAKLARAY